MRNIKYIGIGLSIALILGFSGCGDSGSTTPTTTAPTVNTPTLAPVIVSGKFIDAPVEGLSYYCSSGLSGVTDINGTFTCHQNDNVTFKIGSLILGNSTVKDVITPLHLYTDVADVEKAYNVSQILHSLDNDANPDNNIKLDAALLSTISLSGININSDSSTFQNALASSLASAGKTAYNREQAEAKMYSYINANDATGNYGLSINSADKLQALEIQMCTSFQKLSNGECQAKTLAVPAETINNETNQTSNTLDRANDEYLIFNAKSLKVTAATGWEKNSSTGKWIENQNYIYSSTSSYWISHLDQNFNWLQISTVTYNGKTYYVLLDERSAGYYYYQYIREDWTTFNKTNYMILTSEQYNEFKNNIINGTGTVVTLESSYIGSIDSKYNILGGEYAYNDENLLISITKELKSVYNYSTMKFKYTSFTNNGNRYVRFKLPESYCYGDCNLETSYFEVSTSGFEALFSF